MFIPVAELKPPDTAAGSGQQSSKQILEKRRLEKQFTKLKALVTTLEAQLSPSHGFMRSATSAKIEKQKAVLERNLIELRAIENALMLFRNDGAVDSDNMQQ